MVLESDAVLEQNSVLATAQVMEVVLASATVLKLVVE
jgi:hypothetical protein